MDVGAEADGDGESGVGSYDGVVPDGRFVPVGDVADDGGRGCDEGVVGFEGFVVHEGHFGTVAGEYLDRRERGLANNHREEQGERGGKGGERREMKNDP